MSTESRDGVRAQKEGTGGERPYPFTPVQALDLHTLYQQARKNEPLCPVRMPYGDPGLLVTRYEDVRTVFTDPRFRRSVPEGTDQPRVTPELMPMGLMEMDPPDHTRIRRLIAGSFTAQRAERMRPSTERLADSLLDAMVAAGPPADLVRDFAVPFPIGVICDLLGVPYQDRHRFHQWVTEVNQLAGGDSAPARLQSLGELLAYMGGLIQARRADPADDLISELVVAHDQDDRLSEDELVFLCMLLLIAGYETTANEIANFAYVLFTHPDQLALLKARPELLPDAVEELLRFTPLTVCAAYPRYATTDVELGGGTVPAGSPVLTSTNAANRDPGIFDGPDLLDLTRSTGRQHLAFGHGPHHCVGASLARMELQVALGALLARLPDLRLAGSPDSVDWKTGLLFRGPEKLSVAW
ncbi:cytochrome P450 [Kitasatospora sp. NPDC001527]|uniref:cytochrome P450 n=1 Tax=Kitasatospora sp. NPDC001527 TaxID=3154519 RepID=UPI00333066A4